MNRFCVFFIFSLVATQIQAQSDNVNPLVISVVLNKTSSLVFPEIIKSIDIGSHDVLAQKVQGVENVVQVKAASENFAETNMTVITANGKLYSFLVQYASEPQHFIIQIDKGISIFEKIAAQKKSMRRVKKENYEMKVQLKGLYIENNILYFQIELENQSNISYDIDMLRFYIKDKKQSSRTASQELDQVPMSVFGNTSTVTGQSKQTIVAALPKFTIPDKKIFYFQVMEKNGGRNLQLKVTSKKILKARTLTGT